MKPDVVGGDQHQSRLAVQYDAAGDRRQRERKFGRIINISSINGQKGQFGKTNYSAAKAGEFGFTKALAQEARASASPSMRSLPVTSTPKWCRRCERRS